MGHENHRFSLLVLFILVQLLPLIRSTGNSLLVPTQFSVDECKSNPVSVICRYDKIYIPKPIYFQAPVQLLFHWFQVGPQQFDTSFNPTPSDNTQLYSKFVPIENQNVDNLCSLYPQYLNNAPILNKHPILKNISQLSCYDYFCDSNINSYLRQFDETIGLNTSSFHQMKQFYCKFCNLGDETSVHFDLAVVNEQCDRFNVDQWVFRLQPSQEQRKICPPLSEPEFIWQDLLKNDPLLFTTHFGLLPNYLKQTFGSSKQINNNSASLCYCFNDNKYMDSNYSCNDLIRVELWIFILSLVEYLQLASHICILICFGLFIVFPQCVRRTVQWVKRKRCKHCLDSKQIVLLLFCLAHFFFTASQFLRILQDHLHHLNNLILAEFAILLEYIGQLFEFSTFVAIVCIVTVVEKIFSKIFLQDKNKCIVSNSNSILFGWITTELRMNICMAMGLLQIAFLFVIAVIFLLMAIFLLPNNPYSNVSIYSLLISVFLLYNFVYFVLTLSLPLQWNRLRRCRAVYQQYKKSNTSFSSNSTDNSSPSSILSKWMFIVGLLFVTNFILIGGNLSKLISINLFSRYSGLYWSIFEILRQASLEITRLIQSIVMFYLLLEGSSFRDCFCCMKSGINAKSSSSSLDWEPFLIQHQNQLKKFKFAQKSYSSTDISGITSLNSDSPPKQRPKKVIVVSSSSTKPYAIEDEQEVVIMDSKRTKYPMSSSFPSHSSDEESSTDEEVEKKIFTKF